MGGRVTAVPLYLKNDQYNPLLFGELRLVLFSIEVYLLVSSRVILSHEDSDFFPPDHFCWKTVCKLTAETFPESSQDGTPSPTSKATQISLEEVTRG